jgi:hypothetical protein
MRLSDSAKSLMFARPNTNLKTDYAKMRHSHGEGDMYKQTIQDVDAKLEALHRKLMRTVRAIDELRAKRKKMVTGEIKVPPPKPVKVMFRDLPFNDDLPDFADRPVAPGCRMCAAGEPLRMAMANAPTISSATL